MEIFRNLHFELSFADALIHMPKFAPMFKKMLNNKDKLIELTKTPLNENCSAVVLKKLPEKLGDPGRFLIPCDFSDLVSGLNDTKIGVRIATNETISKPTGVARIVFVKERYALNVDQSLTLNVVDTSFYSYNNLNRCKKVDLIDVTCEEYITRSFRFVRLRKLYTFLLIADDSQTSPEVDEAYYDPEGGHFLLESAFNK
ncbi:hypothetical protein Tco_1317896 [Tanacetum coccineum]